MKTELIKIDSSDVTFSTESLNNPLPLYRGGEFPDNFLQACKQVRNVEGTVIGIPTETVYGLGGNALNDQSIRSIYLAKGRPSDNPLIVHISSLDMLYSLLPKDYKLPEIYLNCILKYWPGPLTILLPKSDLIPNLITNNQDTVAIRFPSHPVARAFISLCNVPIAAPSANLSGLPSPTTALHVLNDLNQKIPFIIDSGTCDVGLESTVLDALSTLPVILRPGGITIDQLRLINGLQNIKAYKRKDYQIDEAKQIETIPTTPGMKYKHYSPKAKVYVMDPILNNLDNSNITDTFLNAINSLPTNNNQNHLPKIAIVPTQKLSILPIEQWIPSDLTKHFQFILSPIQQNINNNEENNLAHELFFKLRELDSLNFDFILIQGVKEDGMGLAVMNRLRKAATKIFDY